MADAVASNAVNLLLKKMEEKILKCICILAQVSFFYARFGLEDSVPRNTRRSSRTKWGDKDLWKRRVWYSTTYSKA